MLATIRTVRDEAARAEALGRTAERLPQEQWAEALDIARAFTDEGERERTLAVLFPHALANTAAPEAVAAVRALSNVHFQANVLRELAERGADERRTGIAREALAAARTIPDSWRPQALARVVPLLPADERPGAVRQCLAAVHAWPRESSRANVLADLPLSLPAEFAGDVLAAARGIGGAHDRAWWWP